MLLLMNPSTNLKILDQGKDWLVIDKPQGVTVHNDPNDVLHLLRSQLKLNSSQELHLVHRLDKETSGLLLLAMNSKTAANLATQFQDRTTNKLYRAVLRGPITSNEQEHSWTFPISDKAEGRKNPQGMAKDRLEAKTNFRILQCNSYFSLAELKLFTGRQHQIRKHAALAKHAIVGDPRYGDPKYNERMAQIYGTSRMFLHAYRLSIAIEGIERVFEAEMPIEFNNLLTPGSLQS